MKKIFLSLFISFTLGNTGICQTDVYHPFPDSAMWRVDYVVHNPFQNYYFYDYFFHYYISGDTIINAKEYKKLYRSFFYVTHISVQPPWQVPQSEAPCYFGALRDDSIADKAFFVYAGTSTDSLLFDYHLMSGDTVRGIPGQTYYGYKTVHSVDSVLIDGSYRRRWNLDSVNLYGTFYAYPYIIEGIGSSSGLIDVICDYHVDFTDRYLVCVTNESSVLFESGYVSEMGCEPIVESVPELSDESNIRAYPNPFSQSIAIETDVVLNNATLLLYDAYGNMVRSIGHISGNSILLERNNLSVGLYFCTLTQSWHEVATVTLFIIDQ